MVSPSLTPQAIVALAPDPASLKAGQKLVSPAKWPTLAQTEGVLWGECQGSGAHPYVVAADLRSGDVATKCTCPSRKFPCKHALALLLLSAEGKGQWQTLAPPAEVEKWLEGRVARAEKSEAKVEATKKAADPEQQAKTWAKREKKMSAGLEALELWLTDLVREGLLAAKKRPYSEWDGQAARMVDAQLPGVARQIRQIPDLLHEESGVALTAHLGRLALLASAWRRRSELSAPEQADLLSALGLPLDKATLLPAAPQTWLCAGSLQEEEGRLTVRRTWLLGSGGDVALLLDFAPQGQGWVSAYASGQAYAGALAFAPSAFRQRAVFEGEVTALGPEPLPPRPFSLGDLSTHWAQALAQQPWLERVGVCIGPAYLAEGQLCDLSGQSVPLHGEVSSGEVWRFQAEAETEPTFIFGEWDGVTFRPLSLTRVSPS